MGVFHTLDNLNVVYLIYESVFSPTIQLIFFMLTNIYMIF
jgi:hypothetical protein